MAEELITFKPLGTGSYELVPNEETLSHLQQNFSDDFTPVLFVKDTEWDLNTSLPLDFVRPCRKDIIYVWPNPIAIKGKNLLLMKISGLNLLERDKDKIEAIQRLLCVLLSVSTQCIVKFEVDSLFDSLEFLQRYYGKLQEKRLHKVYFSVLMTSRGWSQIDSSAQETYMSSGAAKFTKFIMEEEWKTPETFYEILLGGMEIPQRRMKEWASVFMISISLVNIDIDETYFLEQLQHFDEIEEPLRAVKTLHNHYSRLRSVSARYFLVRGNGRSCKIDSDSFSIIESTFDPDKPVVVMTVIGGQGIGKSTFLNYLIQRAFRTRVTHKFFDSGNTVYHTTNNSLVFPFPIPIPNSESQMMLIDLEGLNQIRKQTDLDSVVMHNLVLGILTVSSVPCIFIQNHRDHQDTIQRYIRLFASLSQKFSFQCNRIFLLHYDKDFSPDPYTTNADLENWIKDLNTAFFNKSPVICLINKPNFTDSGKDNMRCQFLDYFLSHCNHPKFNLSSPALRISDILNQVNYIASCSSTDREVIAEDFTSIDKKKNEKLRELEELSSTITYNPEISLVHQFIEIYRKIVCEVEISKLSINKLQYILQGLESKACDIYKELMMVVFNFSVFISWKTDEISAHVERKLNQYCKNSLWVKTFQRKCARLEQRLYSIAKYYPHQKERVTLAINELKAKRESFTFQYYRHYAAQTVSLAVAAGLGLSAISIPCALGSAISFGSLPLAHGVYFVSSKATNSPRSQVLFTAKEESDKGNYSIKLNKPPRLFILNSKKCIVLVVARRSFGVAQMLNSFALEVSELSSQYTMKFSDNEIAQVIPFMYPNRDAEGAMLLFTLQGTSADKCIELITSQLYFRVSVCCFFENEENDFILNVLQAPHYDQLSMGAKVLFGLSSLTDSFVIKLQEKVSSMSLSSEVHHFRSDSDNLSNMQRHLCDNIRDSRLLLKFDAENVFMEVKKIAQSSVIGG